MAIPIPRKAVSTLNQGTVLFFADPSLFFPQKSKGHKSAPSIHAWKDKCQHLVELLMECEDSEPFREPVNIIDYPVGRQVT